MSGGSGVAAGEVLRSEGISAIAIVFVAMARGNLVGVFIADDLDQAVEAAETHRQVAVEIDQHVVEAGVVEDCADDDGRLRRERRVRGTVGDEAGGRMGP